jgi:hypothetical protein
VSSVLSNFELGVPHLAIPSVESCTGSARHRDFWQLKPLNGSLSQWHTTPNSNLDEALVSFHGESGKSDRWPNGLVRVEFDVHSSGLFPQACWQAEPLLGCRKGITLDSRAIFSAMFVLSEPIFWGADKRSAGD